MSELIIGDDTYIPPSMMDGTFGRGLVPRDMASFPVGSFAPPASIKLIPRPEWSGRIKEMEADKSRLSDVLRRSGLPSLNQNDPRYMQTRAPRWGYCWAYGTVGAVMAVREAMNLPRVQLSAFGVAYTIKGGRDEGAWGALSLDFAIKRGIPTEADWPNFEQRMRSESDPCWQTAQDYRVTGGWMELEPAAYDRDLTFDQMMTCLLNRIPVVVDLMWWGHCVYACDPVETSPGKFGIRIRNSWDDSWGDKGFAVLSGSKAIPDNAVAPAVVLAS